MTITRLDLTGLKGPLPTLLMRKALKRLPPGGRLEVHCTDPMAAIDIPVAVQQSGDHLDHSEHNGELIIFVISKRNALIGNPD